ncbi:MAG: TIGR04282 family arsenosugar biosynthesis glycosyltransferase [Rhodospirillales bacterium]
MRRGPVHVFVFAKWPALGRVKSRLAADTGPVFAAHFARLCTERVLRSLARDRRITLHLAVSPDRWVSDPIRCWRLADRRLGQGDGDLGARMARALSAPLAGPKIVVGCDLPGLDATKLNRAIHALGRNDLVFGPAGDGGYWLVGWRGDRPLPPGFLQNVRWGGPQALADSRADLPSNCRIHLVETIYDVDKLEDMERACRGLTPPWKMP